MSTSLEMAEVEKCYGAVKAVDCLSLTVAPGEFVTLLGPSGSGKTTALKLIAGFEYPTSGEVRLGGESIGRMPPYRRGIGMVFQNYALFPHMTVAENVAFPLSVRKTARAELQSRVKEALEMVRLGGYGERMPSQLSGGQQQRVALARAIVFNPRLLLMDEPLGALDRNLRDHMKAEIMRIKDALGVTVIFVTHDQDEALTMSDRIAVMRAGRLEQIDDGPTLYRHPKNRFVAEFLGESNLIPCTLSASQNGRARIRLTGETHDRLASASTAGPKSGWLLIRPEQIRLAPQATGGDGEESACGVVTSSVYLGEATRYSVDCGAFSLSVKRQNVSAARFTAGDRVCVSWAAEAARVVCDDISQHNQSDMEKA